MIHILLSYKDMATDPHNQTLIYIGNRTIGK